MKSMIRDDGKEIKSKLNFEMLKPRVQVNTKENKLHVLIYEVRVT